MLILYAPRDCWLHLLAAGWSLPWVVDTDRSGWSVLLEMDEVKRVLALTDAEIIAETEAEGLAPAEEAAKGRAVFERALSALRERRV